MSSPAESEVCPAPRNSSGNYCIPFARKRELTEIAGCYTQGPPATLTGSGGQFTASHP